jgi:hypothetical protein
MNWKVFKLEQEYMINTIILYVSFIFFFVATFIIIGGFIDFINVSDKVSHYFYFLSSIIPMLLVKLIMDGERDPEMDINKFKDKLKGGNFYG